MVLDKAGILMEQGAPVAAERLSYSGSMPRSHYHPYFELYYLEEGKRFHMLENDIYQTEPGDMMLFAPYTMHHSYSHDADERFKRIVLYFSPEAIADPKVLEKLRNGSGLYHVDTKFGHYIHGMLGMLLMEQDETDELHDATMRTTLNMIVLSLLKAATPAEKPEAQSLISRMVEYIYGHYSEDIRLDDLAEQFYVSKFYLCHEFKKYTNRTISQYINTTRILQAQREIMDTNRSLTKIASDCGFASCTHFSRTFKALTGTTPMEFRKSYKQKRKYVINP